MLQVDTLPVICSAGNFSSQKRFRAMQRSPQRTVSVYELELYHQDEGISILNGREYPIRRGMLLIARPGDVRSTTLPFCNHFIRLSKVDEEFAALLDGVAGVTVVENEEECERRFARISACFLSDDPYNRAAAAAELIFILHMARRHARAGDGDQPRETDVVTLARQYIDEHYQEELSVDELARLCHVSTPYLHRLFVKHLGVTPHSALLRRRLVAAKVMLINEPWPIAEVAWRCGFQSASYFSDCFRRHVGMSPIRFRKETGYQL